MNNLEKYAKAYTEVEVVISILDDSLKKKIPTEIIQTLAENKDKEYVFNYDFNKPIYEQNICMEAKIILSTLYKDYLCSDEERKKWKEYDLFCLMKKEDAKKRDYKDAYIKFNKKSNNS